jgi:alpha-acetolactate decarboxylase
VNGCILADFLKSNSKSRNFDASDFASDFSIQNRNEIDGKLQLLDRQLFHPAKAREVDPAAKFDTKKAAVVFNWIERNFTLFENAIKDEYRLHWKPENIYSINPSASHSTVPLWTGPVQSATNVVIESRTDASGKMAPTVEK